METTTTPPRAGSQEQSTQGKSTQDNSTQDKSMQGRPTQNKSTQGKSTQEQSTKPAAESAAPAASSESQGADAPAAAQEGDRVPDTRLKVLRPKAAGGTPRWEDIDAARLFANRSVLLFALPGAFTPTCSSQHLPRYEELSGVLCENGVDEIVCLAVNDPFVMQAWAKEQGVREVTLASDGNCEFTEKMGMAVDKSDLAFGRRSRRYSMLVRDGVIETLYPEPHDPGDPYGKSDADTMLRHLNPQAKTPDRVVIFTREGCPHCAAAREMLEDADLDYVEIPLEESVRATAIGAITGRDTVPQVFMNGRHIGGADDLEKALYGEAGRQPRTA